MVRIKAVRHKRLCACGCGELIDSFYRWPSEQIYYKKGHSWNKGKSNTWCIGEKNVRFSNYRSKTTQGYFEYRKDSRQLEHRKVYEEYYNCCLLPNVDVHHINANKQDNRIDNLQPMFKSDHTIFHKRGKKIRDSVERQSKISNWQ